ncbi:MAG: hypothetical protein NVS9B15_14410 [Acidobacteriaceae bacterium]
MAFFIDLLNFASFASHTCSSCGGALVGDVKTAARQSLQLGATVAGALNNLNRVPPANVFSEPFCVDNEEAGI